MTIKEKRLFTKHYTWDFVAKLWWDSGTGQWCAEIWKDHQYECTHVALTLEELQQELTELHSEKI